MIVEKERRKEGKKERRREEIRLRRLPAGAGS
jgi:hypothetical protein